MVVSVCVSAFVRVRGGELSVSSGICLQSESEREKGARSFA